MLRHPEQTEQVFIPNGAGQEFIQKAAAMEPVLLAIRKAVPGMRIDSARSVAIPGEPCRIFLVMPHQLTATVENLLKANGIDIISKTEGVANIDAIVVLSVDSFPAHFNNK